MRHDTAILLWNATALDMNLRDRYTPFAIAACVAGSNFELHVASDHDDSMYQQNINDIIAGAKFLREWADALESCFYPNPENLHAIP